MARQKDVRSKNEDVISVAN